MLLEAFTCECRDRRNEWKVVCRRYDRDMPHVDGQFREIRLYVRAFLIPPDQSVLVAPGSFERHTIKEAQCANCRTEAAGRKLAFFTKMDEPGTDLFGS